MKKSIILVLLVAVIAETGWSMSSGTLTGEVVHQRDNGDVVIDGTFQSATDGRTGGGLFLPRKVPPDVTFSRGQKVILHVIIAEPVWISTGAGTRERVTGVVVVATGPAPPLPPQVAAKPVLAVREPVEASGLMLRTLSGKEYRDVKITRATPLRVEITFPGGFATIPIMEVPVAMREHFAAERYRREVTLERVRRWAVAACTTGEEQRVYRWTVGPTVSCAGATAAEREAFNAAVADLNEALAASPMRLLSAGAAGGTRASIQVFFGSRSEVMAFNRNNGITRKPGEGNMWLWRNPDFTLERAIYAIDRTDACSTPEMRRYSVRRALLFALGFDICAGEFSDSIFSTPLPFLGEVDRRLISIFYTHLRIGDNADAVRGAINRFWDAKQTAPQ